MDRFSWALDSEWKRKNDSFLIDDVVAEEVPKCCGCGHEMYMGEENIVPSLIYDDDYMHDDVDCISAYYEGLKRAAGQGNSRH